MALLPQRALHAGNFRSAWPVSLPETLPASQLQALKQARQHLSAVKQTSAQALCQRTERHGTYRGRVSSIDQTLSEDEPVDHA